MGGTTITAGGDGSTPWGDGPSPELPVSLPGPPDLRALFHEAHGGVHGVGVGGGKGACRHGKCHCLHVPDRKRQYWEGGGGFGAKALRCCCSRGRGRRQSTSRHSRRSTKAAVLAQNLWFSIGGGSWHQHMKDPHGNNLRCECGVQILCDGGVPRSSTGAQSACGLDFTGLAQHWQQPPFLPLAWERTIPRTTGTWSAVHFRYTPGHVSDELPRGTRVRPGLPCPVFKGPGWGGGQSQCFYWSVHLGPGHGRPRMEAVPPWPIPNGERETVQWAHTGGGQTFNFCNTTRTT